MVDERLHRAASAVATAIVPPRCAQCDAPQAAAHNHPLCQRCLETLPWHLTGCAQCGEWLVEAESRCGRCQQAPPAFTRTVSPLRWAAPISDWISGLKYHRQLHRARPLARLLADAAREHTLPDALLAVPLHDSRIRMRGFNQSLEIAVPVARQLGRPLLRGALERQRRTQAQQGRSRAERLRNMRGAFAVTDAGQRALQSKHVALIDDVLTTGATADAAARALLDAGARRVDVWVVARATRVVR